MSYNMKVTEGFFQSNIHILIKLLGFKILSELDTNIGRIDSVVETLDYLFIFEFRTKSAQIALRQILDKKYYAPFLGSSKSIYLVGVSVDPSTRNILEWKSIKYSRI
jgi:hypothetical protein